MKVSHLFAAAEGGDRLAADSLFATLYEELRRLSKHQRACASSGPVGGLGTTTLLHETYLDMSAREGMSFPDRGRFMAYAARAMRGLVIDHARRGYAQKRGGRVHITTLGDDVGPPAANVEELAAISDALDELAQVEPALAEVVDLRFFSGFSFADIANLQGVSERTVQRHWEKARIFLHRSLRAGSLSQITPPAL